MIGIAFDFGRMTFVTFREQTGGKPPSGIAVAKNIGLPGTSVSGCLT